MTVVKISQEQATGLQDQTFDGGTSFYCPIQDSNGNWIISTVEAEAGDIAGEFIEWQPITE